MQKLNNNRSSAGKKRRRFFEITKVDGRMPKTYVEYDREFGEFIYRTKHYRWECVFDREVWLIASNLVCDYVFVVINLKERMDKAWEAVDLSDAGSLPKKLQKRTEDFTKRSKK